MRLKVPHRSNRSKRLLGCLYSVPDPLKDSESRERFYHHDLASLTKAELYRERDRVRWRLMMEDSPDHWLLERLDVVTGRLEEMEGASHES